MPRKKKASSDLLTHDDQVNASDLLAMARCALHYTQPTQEPAPATDPGDADLQLMLLSMAPPRRKAPPVKALELMADWEKMTFPILGEVFDKKYMSQAALLVNTGDLQGHSILAVRDLGYQFMCTRAKYDGYCWLCKSKHVTVGRWIVPMGAGWADYTCAFVYYTLLNTPSATSVIKMTEAITAIKRNQANQLRAHVMTLGVNVLDDVLGKRDAKYLLDHCPNEDAIVNAVVSRYMVTWNHIATHLVTWFGLSVDEVLDEYAPEVHERLSTL